MGCVSPPRLHDVRCYTILESGCTVTDVPLEAGLPPLIEFRVGVPALFSALGASNKRSYFHVSYEALWNGLLTRENVTHVGEGGLCRRGCGQRSI